MKRRPKVIWVAESDLDGEILRHPATGLLIIGTNKKSVKDDANNLTSMFNLIKYKRVG